MEQSAAGFLPSPLTMPTQHPTPRSGAGKWEQWSNYRKPDDKMTRAGEKLLIFLGLFCLHLENKLNTVTKYYIYVYTHTQIYIYLIYICHIYYIYIIYIYTHIYINTLT